MSSVESRHFNQLWINKSFHTNSKGKPAQIELDFKGEIRLQGAKYGEDFRIFCDDGYGICTRLIIGNHSNLDANTPNDTPDYAPQLTLYSLNSDMKIGRQQESKIVRGDFSGNFHFRNDVLLRGKAHVYNGIKIEGGLQLDSQAPVDATPGCVYYDAVEQAMKIKVGETWKPLISNGGDLKMSSVSIGKTTSALTSLDVRGEVYVHNGNDPATGNGVVWYSNGFYLRNGTPGGPGAPYNDRLVLDRDGNLSVSGTLKAGHFFPFSDDRLKHNEVPVTKALEAIEKVKVFTYDKTNEFLDVDHTGPVEIPHYKDTGVIAQELYEIKELRHLVNAPDDENKPYSVNYNGLFSYALSAIKELNVIVTNLSSRITELESKVMEK